jgi:hypothetical protein
MRLLFANPASIMPELLNGGAAYQNFMLGGQYEPLTSGAKCAILPFVWDAPHFPGCKVGLIHENRGMDNNLWMF